MIAIYASLHRNRRRRGQYGAEVLLTEESETELANRRIIPGLSVHIELTLDGGHLPPCTNPGKSITGSCIEEEVSDAVGDRHRVNSFGDTLRQIVTFVDIEAVDVKPILETSGETFTGNGLPLTSGGQKVGDVSLCFERIRSGGINDSNKVAHRDVALRESITNLCEIVEAKRRNTVASACGDPAMGSAIDSV